jgi:hypothetical protein
MTKLVDALAAEIARHGMMLRGHCALEPEGGISGATAVLIGNAGPQMWGRFQAERLDEPDPLDRWVRRCLTPIAEVRGAQLVMPSDGPPYAPFQRWAMRAEPVHPSPLGLLIHPEYGLWHAYRAALVFDGPPGMPKTERRGTPSPCDTCADKPCLATCPVGAFTEGGYDVPRCHAHLGSNDGAACMDKGCLARHACPVGRDFTTGAEQSAFHMLAFREGRF